MFVLFFIVSLALIEARTKHVVNCYTEGLYCLMMATHLLDIQKLTKQYAGTNYLAIDSVTLQVDPGEVYGFLGANGAGKSTTIRTLLNFIQPSSGTATIRGHDIVKEAVALKRCVGYLSGEVALYSKATGREFLAYMAALQPLKHADYFSALIKRFDMTLNQPIETLSKGNRQKQIGRAHV